MSRCQVANQQVRACEVKLYRLVGGEGEVQCREAVYLTDADGRRRRDCIAEPRSKACARCVRRKLAVDTKKNNGFDE
jgi:hypothetical protein